MRKSTGDVTTELIDFGRDAVKEGGSIAREAIAANERRAEAEIAAKTASDAARAQAQQAAQQPLQVNPANQVQLGPPPTVPTQAPMWSTGEKVAIGGTIVTVIATAGGILLKVFGR
jgi:CHASE3 domain sensor protein